LGESFEGRHVIVMKKTHESGIVLCENGTVGAAYTRGRDAAVERIERIERIQANDNPRLS
jgi:hypothetical protein